MKRTKSRKAAGVDEVCPELFRADMEDTASRLTSCYNRLWETDRWPKVCKKGLLVKVFKKGDLHECNNCRGPTLLHVISKIFCRMLLERIKKGETRNFERIRLGFDPREVHLNRSLYLETS